MNNQKGFTIIEVMIVLAIASVILLGVLLVVPALQRSGRNSARERDVGTITTALNNYRGSFQKLPDPGTSQSDGEFSIDGKATGAMSYYNTNQQWLLYGTKDDKFEYSGTPKKWKRDNTSTSAVKIETFTTTGATSSHATGKLNASMVVIVTGSQCSDSTGDTISTVIAPATINGAYAVIYALEGDTAIICRDNV